jgi:hypothetical protein
MGLGGLQLAVAASLIVGANPRTVAAQTAGKPNACGCYRDSTGSCFCGKKGKCACPGDCEPKGCEEKRARELDKEIAAETKKAAAGKSISNAKESSSDSRSNSNEESGSKKKGKEAHLTAAQKKELGRLLDTYLSEHPEGHNQTISEVRRTLGN